MRRPIGGGARARGGSLSVRPARRSSRRRCAVRAARWPGPAGERAVEPLLDRQTANSLSRSKPCLRRAWPVRRGRRGIDRRFRRGRCPSRGGAGRAPWSPCDLEQPVAVDRAYEFMRVGMGRRTGGEREVHPVGRSGEVRRRKRRSDSVASWASAAATSGSRLEREFVYAAATSRAAASTRRVIGRAGRGRASDEARPGGPLLLRRRPGIRRR
jgi:hypothetical protein